MKTQTIILLVGLFLLNPSSYAVDPMVSDIGHRSSVGLTFNSIQTLDAAASEDKLSIVAVGDILLHAPLHKQALKLTHKSLWKHVLPYLSNAHMTYGNLEGPVAPGINSDGEEVPDPGMVFDEVVYTSYPRFNYHESLIQDLVDSGFDVVSTANNHSLDHRSTGVNKTIDMLNQDGMQFTGTRKSNDVRNGSDVWPTIVERNGFRIAWLACTFSTNGTTDKANQVLHCFKQTKLILSMIKELSLDPNIDAVIVTPHVGVEYEDLPESKAVGLYRSFSEAGALAIIGAHPHVLQPWEKFVTVDKRETFIIYSLGNFVSGQFHKVKTRGSILLNLNLVRNQNGKASISHVQYLPIEMRRSRTDGYTVMPISPHFGTPEIYNHITGMFGNKNLFQPQQANPSAQSGNKLQ